MNYSIGSKLTVKAVPSEDYEFRGAKNESGALYWDKRNPPMSATIVGYLVKFDSPYSSFNTEYTTNEYGIVGELPPVWNEGDPKLIYQEKHDAVPGFLYRSISPLSYEIVKAGGGKRKRQTRRKKN